jgi:hypothetical protein
MCLTPAVVLLVLVLGIFEDKDEKEALQQSLAHLPMVVRLGTAHSGVLVCFSSGGPNIPLGTGERF